MAVKNKKAKGSRNELKSKELLELWGYKVCKSGGSLGEFDLVGICSQNIFLIQCKTNQRPDNEELMNILDFQAPFNAFKRVHIWIDRIKEPLIWTEDDIRKVLRGEPLEDNSISSFRNSRRRTKNSRKSKGRNKQRATKKSARTGRGDNSSKNGKLNKRTKSVRGKRKDASVSRRGV